MEGFFFGSQNELMGLYHEANQAEDKNLGVVLVYPFGQEYMRCHRAFVVLANKLSQSGIHVLRFDLLGCGDSKYDLLDITFQNWLENINQAINELKAGSGVKDIFLVGCRLGATKSLLATQLNSIRGVILWHPVINGADYIKELNDQHLSWMKGSFARKDTIQHDHIEFQGFAVSSPMIEKIAKLDLLETPLSKSVEGLIIGKPNGKYMDALKANVSNFTFFESQSHDFWIKGDNENQKQLVPVKDIEMISNWLISKTRSNN